ncbi:MAG: ribonuclease PH [Verrucomicrobiota bacterium]
MKRTDGRKTNQLRPFELIWDIAPNASGSVLIKCGNTQVICAASIEESVPKWMERQDIPGGWLTAEYSMLPASTLDRKPRDINKGKLDGRSQEIQRLIGRSLRAVIDLKSLGKRTIWLDCDVLAADGGTRTTAITGAYLAMKQAVHRLIQKGLLKKTPFKSAVAATSVGIYQGTPILDLCYIEDRDASVDMNVVMTNKGEFVEIGATGEEATFSPDELNNLLALAKSGLKKLFTWQNTMWKQHSDH